MPENEAEESAASKTLETPNDISEHPLDDSAPQDGAGVDDAAVVRNEDLPENQDAPEHLDETADPSESPLIEEIAADAVEENTDTQEQTPEDTVAREEEALEERADDPVEEAVEETERPTPPPVQQSSSIWPAVFGGVIAALLGFIAGRGDQLDAYLPSSMQRQAVDVAPLAEQTSALTEQTATLAEQASMLTDANAALVARIEELETAAPDTTSQSAASDLDEVQATVAALTERLAALEARPAETVETVIQQPADNSEEISALQSAVEALQAQISEEEARATAEAERILAQAALTRVVTAVESGEAFEPALGALEEVTPVEVPEALRAAAIEGVPSMAMLRENFPDAARAGLAAARAEVPETEVSGISGFLRRQLSARSVTPREGSDPDAVLSRAEAAVKAGSLDEALAELDALPDASKTAMQDWLEGAKARQTAREAAQNLADSLTVN
ncbi:COG4223 family protein [uncultured Roseobacter sp.]|uniref:COG4223 family protein n=1 Tax=uncultured Roseobacter sp. TaxID=114847 RepID=UPI00260480FE|nr:mitofilin family membrane protein [uncultured Roseobacter sp.]